MSEVKQAFNQLRDVFMRAFILRHFDSEWYTHIEINAFNYAVASILFQSDDEDQWHSIAFWFKMMINVERNYEIHDQKLLVIVAMFKHWQHYVKDNYHTVEVLTKLIVKLSFDINLLTRLKYLISIFWLDLNTWFQHSDSIWYQS